MIDPKLWEQACENAQIEMCRSTNARGLTLTYWECLREIGSGAIMSSRDSTNHQPHYPPVGDPATVSQMQETLKITVIWMGHDWLARRNDEWHVSSATAKEAIVLCAARED